MQLDPTLSMSFDQRIAQLRVQFEKSLPAGDFPRIEDVLQEVDNSARPQLLRVLLGVELNRRHRAGQSPVAGEYLERFPEYPELVLEVLGQAATEIDAKTLASTDQAVETEDAAAAPVDAPARPAVSATLSHRPETGEKSKELRPDETGKRKVTLDDFVSSLTECGLMDQVEVDAFIEELPADERPINGKQLAELLYRHKRLTRFQVQAVYQRKTRGLVVGNYVVLDRIGKGGMGQVYKAQHRRMKRVVALKMLPWDTSKSPHAIARFQREAEAAARLNHPNIVTAYDADEARGVHFLVMEYVDGEDLAARIKRTGPLPVRTAVECILQAAQGLAYAHSHGVIHRDIKPANLLCDRQGTVKVLDMGLARIEQAVGADQDHSLTNTGQVMGTLDYMPPEQALDTCLADARSDIYSLGCSLHYLLTGRHPYGGDTLAKKLLAHRNDPIPLIAARRSDVPASVQSIFAAMVAKEPADRPQTMQEVIEMLERCLAETTAQSTEPTESFHAEDVQEIVQDLDDEQVPFEEVELDKTLALSQRLLAESAPPISHRTKPAPRPNRQDWMLIGTVAGSLCLLLVLGSIVALLRSHRGTLVVEVNQPGATVEVRDTDGLFIVRGVTDADPLTFSIPPGEGRVQVEKDGFTFHTQDFTLERRGHAVVRARLEPLPPAEGTLRLTVNEPRASVELVDTTGKTIARYRTTNESLSVRLAEGNYRVLVEKPGFAPFDGSVVISQNHERVVAVTLVSKSPVTTQRTPGPAVPSSQSQAPPPWNLPSGSPPPAIAPFDAAEAKSHQEAWAQHLGVEVEMEDTMGMRFVLIPPGEFDMGSTEEEVASVLEQIGLADPHHIENVLPSEIPKHRVRITKPFWLGRNEVTREQFQRFVDETEYQTEAQRDGTGSYGAVQDEWKQDPRFVWNRELGVEDASRFPVMNVSWNDAQRFCDWLSQKEGKTCHLPSEAQWEYACRAGTTSMWYSGDDEDALNTIGWYRNNSQRRLHPAGQKEPNAWGLYDMIGNVWEWCSDLYYHGYYRSSPLDDPTGPTVGASARVMRGGDYGGVPSLSGLAFPYMHRVAFRGSVSAEHRAEVLGFRVAKTALPNGGDQASDEAIAYRAQATSVSPLRLPHPNLSRKTPPTAIAPFDDVQAKAHQELWAQYLGVGVEMENSIGIKLVLIPPGEFNMGSTQEEVDLLLDEATIEKEPSWHIHRLPSEVPQHRVRIAQPFLMAAREVTVGSFRRFVADTNYVTEAEFHGRGGWGPNTEGQWVFAPEFLWNHPQFALTDDQPVVQVTWNDAVAFCTWLSRKERVSYRLPTEAEWEYACRAGASTQYHFGNDVSELVDYAWFGCGQSHPVGRKKANPWGLFDMHGNVMEWCQDWFDVYTSGGVTNPLGPSSGADRVNRGGSWSHPATYSRVAYRSRHVPSRASSNVGFRVVAVFP